MKPILEIQNISKKFRIQHENQPYLSLRDSLTSVFKKKTTTSEEFYALKDVSFTVNPGESIGIIGRNGAGKSTLLKILSSITPPSSGKIITRGRIASLLEVGTGFHPELTGRENVFLNGSILGMRRHEILKNFDAIVDFAGVEKFIDTPLKHYSSGMQLRLAFAVAAFLENEILIIDEVLAVGDAEFQKKCMGKMEEVSTGGKTVLFVSHQMSTLKQLCKNGILLINGELNYKGGINDTIQSYLESKKQTTLNSIYKKVNINGTDIELIEAEVLNQQNENKSEFSINEDIFISIKINCIKIIPNVYGYVIVKNTQEEVFIESDSYDCLPNNLDQMKLGINTFLLKINSNVLPNGKFIIYINFTSLFADASQLDKPLEILQFEVCDTETKRGMQRRAYTSQLLKWEAKHVI